MCALVRFLFSARTPSSRMLWAFDSALQQPVRCWIVYHRKIKRWNANITFHIEGLAINRPSHAHLCQHTLFMVKRMYIPHFWFLDKWTTVCLMMVSRTPLPSNCFRLCLVLSQSRLLTNTLVHTCPHVAEYVPKIEIPAISFSGASELPRYWR